MPASTFTFSGTSTAEILAADVNRDHYVLQLISSDNTIPLAFGEAAVAATGVHLMEPGATVRVEGSKARLACNGIDAGSNAVIGIETKRGVTYRSGQFAGPWPTS